MPTPLTDAAWHDFLAKNKVGRDTHPYLRPFLRSQGEIVDGLDASKGENLRPYWQRIEARLQRAHNVTETDG